MIIKMEKKNLNSSPFLHIQTRCRSVQCMRAVLPLDKKTVENQDWAAMAGRGPLGRGPAFSKTPKRPYNDMTT